jgi:hypothetical protein
MSTTLTTAGVTSNVQAALADLVRAEMDRNQAAMSAALVTLRPHLDDLDVRAELRRLRLRSGRSLNA